ncbi:MAG: hypothetical protein QOE72_4683 [Chloroflexota bacterium]|jgi:hypothetical protein|nr:hypothetical protein [Chloroflexota bacterium]
MENTDTEYTPSVVSLYAVAPASRTRAARFTYDATSGVQLELLDPDWGDLAQTYFEEGVPLDREQRSVLPGAEPALFMRALLQPVNMSYYYFVDESASDSSR